MPEPTVPNLLEVAQAVAKFLIETYPGFTVTECRTSDYGRGLGYQEVQISLRRNS